MAKKGLKSWAVLIALSFFNASNSMERVEPAFNEAAGGEESGGGVIPSTFQKGILPGFRDNFMGDNIANRVLHNSRKASATFTRDNLRSIHIK